MPVNRQQQQQQQQQSRLNSTFNDKNTLHISAFCMEGFKKKVLKLQVHKYISCNYA